MNSMVVPLLTALVWLGCSSGSYQLHIGDSFSSSTENHGGSMIAGAAVDSMVDANGIYCDSSVFLGQYAVIRVYNNGKYYIPLSTKLPCPDGMLIHIKGKVVQISVDYPETGTRLHHHHLAPMSFEIVSNTRQLIKHVTEEYRRIRTTLQQKITLEGSKLQLAPDPHWSIWFDPQGKRFIFHSHQSDMMYAADIEFIVDANTQKISDVYAREWFKGEM